MSFNDIIVHVDGTEAAKARVAFAVALAKEQDAHLIGIAFAPKALAAALRRRCRVRRHERACSKA